MRAGVSFQEVTMGEMRVRVTGRNIDVGDALRSRIETDLNEGVSRYIARDGEGLVTITKERHLFIVEIQIHLDSGISLEAKAEAGDPHPAFDLALAKIEKRVRRYKRRLKDHHAVTKATNATMEASYAVFASSDDDDGEAEAEVTGDAPLVIAETRRSVSTMAVSTAVLQLEVSDQPALMFRNPSTGGLNMVYRRADGNIGWLDPGAPEAA
jgi:ribosomal subunit interface protein